MNSLDEIGNSLSDKSIKKFDNTSPFADIKTFTTQRQAKQALDSAISNLDVRDVSLFLNITTIEVWNIYKKHNNQSYSDTINIFCERNLETLENIGLSDYEKWLESFNNFITLTNFNKRISDVALRHIFIPSKKVKSEHRDVHVTLDKKYLNRIDKIKLSFIFKNASRDIIIAYLMCLDDFNDLPPLFSKSVKDLYTNFRSELSNFINTVPFGSLHSNIEVVSYLLSNGFLNSDIPLMMNYIKEVLNLCRYEFYKENISYVEYIDLVRQIEAFIIRYESVFTNIDDESGIIKELTDDIKKSLDSLNIIIKDIEMVLE